MVCTYTLSHEYIHLGCKCSLVLYDAVAPGPLPPSTTSSQQCLTQDDNTGCQCANGKAVCCNWSLTSFATNYYGPALQKTPIKVGSHPNSLSTLCITCQTLFLMCCVISIMSEWIIIIALI